MYGKWLFKEIKTEYGRCRVEVFRKGYTASAIEIGALVGNSLNLALENLDTITAPIGKSVCSFEICDTEQFEYDDLFTPDATAYMVVVSTKVGGGAYVTRWSGYVTPDFFAENLSYRTPISISARDNIGYLNDVDFDLDAATITVRELIEAAFNRIAEDYPMSLSFVTQKQTAEGILAIDATISTYLLREMSWYEALETILHDLGLQMRWVDNNTIAVLDISQLGENFGLQRFNFVERSGYREILPAWRELSQKQDYGLRENFFEGWLKSNALTYVKSEGVKLPIPIGQAGTGISATMKYYAPNNWGVAGNTYTINPEDFAYLGAYGQTSTPFGKRIYFTGVDKADTTIAKNYMSWRQNVYKSTERMQITFKAFNSLLGASHSSPDTLLAYNPAERFLGINLGLTTGDYIRLGLKVNLFLHIGTKTYIMRETWEEISGAETSSLYFILDKVGDISEGDNMPKEQEISIGIGNIPANGQLELRIYGFTLEDKKNLQEDANAATYDWLRMVSYINDVTYSYANDNKNTGVESGVEIASLHNIKASEEYAFGQVTLYSGGINAYAGGLFKANGDELVGFKRNVDGSTYPLLELVGREIIHFNKRNYNKLSGTAKNLAKEPLMFNKLLVYKGKNYLPFACSLDVISNRMNITTMQEVESYTTQSFVEIKSELVTGGGATISGGNNTALQYSAEVGNAKRISELNNASESEKKESYIVIDNASWNESKKVPLSEMEGLDEAQVEAYLTENKYAKQSWVKGITDDLETDIANRVLIEDFEKLQEAVDLNYTNLNKATTRISTLEGYFSNGVANNAAKLGGQLPSYYATKSALDTTNTNLSNLSTTVGTIAGNLSSLTGRVSTAEDTIKGHTSSINKAVADIAANAKNISANSAAITTLNSKVTKLESYWYIDNNGNLHTTYNIVSDKDVVAGGEYSGGSGGGGSTGLGTVTIKTVSGQEYKTNANGVVTIPDYQPKGNYLTSVPSGYATESWVGDNYQPKGNYLAAIPTEYITESELTAKKYLTGITSAMVTTALGYVPFNSTSFTKATIKSTLGIADWALAATKPTYTASEVGALSKNGGTISGNIVWNKGKWGVDTSAMGVFMSWNDSNYLHITGDGAFYNWNKLVHAGNYVDTTDKRYLRLSGGTLTGNLSAPLYLFGNGGGTYLDSGASGELVFYDLSARRIVMHSGNIGSYNAGSATKLQTARTIWGQSFDGTGDVSGTLKSATESFILNDSYESPYLRLYNGNATYGYIQLVNNTLHLGYGYSTNNGIYIPTSGNVLIGTTTDSGYKLQVNGGASSLGTMNIYDATNSNTRLTMYMYNNIGRIYAYNSTTKTDHDLWIGGAADGKALTVKANGNVLIGTTTDSGAKMQVAGAINITNEYKIGGLDVLRKKTDNLAIGEETSVYGLIPTHIYGTEVVLRYGTYIGFKLNSSGNVLIGTTTDSGDKLRINGSIRAAGHIRLDRYHGASEYLQLEAEDVNINYRAYDTDGWCSHNFYSNDDLLVKIDGYAGKLDVNGNLVATGDGVFGSDARYKSKLQDLAVDIETIANAPVFSYKWTDREDDKVHLGTTAQYWLDTNFRDAVDTSNKDFYHLNYGALGVAIGVTVAKKVVNHEERILALERENEALKNEINLLRQWHN